MPIDPHDSSFDWNDRESVTVPEQLAVAIYRNPYGAVVIRQERAWDEDSDIYIIIQPENAEAVANAILREAGVMIDHGAANAAFNDFQTRDGSRDNTNAERQRRYRERHRNGVGDNSASTVEPKLDLNNTGEKESPAG